MSVLYATSQELLNHPTGLDLQDLVAGGSVVVSANELGIIMQMASSWVEQIVYQPLYAKSRTETVRIKPDPYGTLTVRLQRYPIASVTSAQWRQYPQNPWITINLSYVDIYATLGEGRKYVAGDTDYGVYKGWGLPPLTVQTTYVHGYPNGVLTAASSVGATTLTVDDATGFVVGTEATIYDAQGGVESVTVSAISGNDLTVAATLYAHAVGVRVSALPAAVSTACIYLAGYLVKERRAGGSIMMAGKMEPQNVAQAEDVQLARSMLNPFVQRV